MTLPAELAPFARWVSRGSRVLDLGCGDGTLLAALREALSVSGYGLEIDPDNIVACLEKGVAVIQTDLNEGLSDFATRSFDYVIMKQTLQAMRHPDRTMEEMLRVGHQGIVTFPNFGYWRNRMQLAVGGRMPVTRALPAEWYETGNIHMCTIADFEALCAERRIEVVDRLVVDVDSRETPLTRRLPRLCGEHAVYLLRRDQV
jgi:methionine biosynthesis protein MetW